MKSNTMQVCVTNSYLIFEYLCCSSYFRGFLSILTAPNHDQLRGAGFLCPSNKSQGRTFCFPDTCKPWKRIDISEVIISLTSKYVFLLNQIHFKALLQPSLSWPITIREVAMAPLVDPLDRTPVMSWIWLKFWIIFLDILPFCIIFL